MRIYRATIEHKLYGQNHDSLKVCARTCEEALRKAKRSLNSSQLRIQEIELIASDEN